MRAERTARFVEDFSKRGVTWFLDSGVRRFPAFMPRRHDDRAVLHREAVLERFGDLLFELGGGLGHTS